MCFSTWNFKFLRSGRSVAGMLVGALALCPAYAQIPTLASAPLKKMSVEELMDIEVTSVSRRAERLSEAASAIQVITQEDIRRSGASSLPEALRLASNLEVARIDSRQWAISARGFNSTTSNKLLVLIDGRTVYTPLYAGVFWDAQDTLLEDIDRIEVISGPGATLWGANAVNGIINITTKNAGDTQGGLLTAAGGDELRGAGGLRYGGTLGADFNYRVYGKYSDRDGTVLPAGVDVSNAWRMAQGGFRIDGQLSDSDALTVQGDLYQGRIEQPALDDVETRGNNLLGRWSRTLSEQSDLKLQFYFDRTHRRIPGSIAEDLDTYDLDFQHRLLVAKRHDLVWGLTYRYIDDTIANPATLAFLPPHVTRQWYGAFAQDEIALIENRLHLTVGTKVEHNEYTGLEFQPSARLAWQLNERHMLWSAASRAVRTPSRIDGELYAPSSPPFSLRGNSDFESETLLAYELGYRGQAYERVSISVSAFYNDYDDVRSVERINPPASLPIFVGNGLKAQSYGAELTADYAVTDTWRLRAGYTEFNIDFDHKPNSTDANPGTNEAHDAEQFWSLRSSLDLPRNFQIDATYRHVSRIANQNVPAYGELDLRLGWRLHPNIELSLVGQNLLHAHHAEFGTVTASTLGTRKEIERSVYGKVLWSF